MTCLVNDLSTDGFLTDAPLPIGEDVVADIPGIGRVPAQVRWSLGARSGLKFGELSNEVRSAVLRHIRAASQPVANDRNDRAPFGASLVG